MKSLKKIMFWLIAGMVTSLTALLISAGTKTRWLFKDGYVKILPVAQWLRHGGSTHFIKQRDGTYLAKMCTYHGIFCVFQAVLRAEEVDLLAQTKGVDLDL